MATFVALKLRIIAATMNQQKTYCVPTVYLGVRKEGKLSTVGGFSLIFMTDRDTLTD